MALRTCPDATRRASEVSEHVEIDALCFFRGPAPSESRHRGVLAQYSPWLKAEALTPSCPREKWKSVRWDAMQKSEVGSECLGVIRSSPKGDDILTSYPLHGSRSRDHRRRRRRHLRPIPDPNGPAWPCRGPFPLLFNQPVFSLERGKR
jgi:hypothetical protein